MKSVCRIQDNIRRIVPGKGGDCTLLLGSEKTAVIDTGMAYCADRLTELLAQELAGRPLDYILLTHSHYDHAGGVPALRKRFPQVQVLASAHAKQVFRRESAQREIRRMAQMAGRLFLGSEEFERRARTLTEYPQELLQADRAVGDGEEVFLGDLTVQVMETPGHTNCSLSFFLPQRRMIFPSETVGCYIGGRRIDVSILTGFEAALRSVESCRQKRAEFVVSPHYGLVTSVSAEEYFDIAGREVCAMREYLRERCERGESAEQMLAESIRDFWENRSGSEEEQPQEAFAINMKATIALVMAGEKTDDKGKE